MSKKKFPVKSEDKVENDSTRDQVEAQRRKAIGRIVATTGIVATMSGNWKKPVLTSAILPAHAESTCEVEVDGECVDDDLSDIRLKTNIQKLESSGVGFQLYRFEYRGDVSHQTYVGVMAQHLEESHPESLIKDSEGLFRVNYGSLGLKMTTLEEWNERGIAAVKAH